MASVVCSEIMNHPSKVLSLLGVAVTVLILPSLPLKAADDDQYSFTVHNTTEEKITKLLASEDGKKYAKFDIGKGIEPDETVKLNWDKKTNEAGCKWYLKAVFADGSESPAKRFDFCEDDVELEF